MAEYAAACLIAHQIERDGSFNQSEAANILRSVAYHKDEIPEVELVSSDRKMPFAVMTKWATRQRLVAHQGLRYKDQLGILIENVVWTWYSMATRTIIPLFDVINKLMLSSVLSAIKREIYPFLLPVKGASRRVAEEVLQSAQIFRGTWKDLPIFAGEVSGGLVAKFMAHNVGSRAISIESTVYNDSFFDFFSAAPSKNAPIHLINVFTSTSLFSFNDPGAVNNLKMPNYQGLWRPRNPYQDMCMLLAACTQYSDYDEFCALTIGMETYMNYFEEWGRPRIL
jgi:hypothetical protein